MDMITCDGCALKNTAKCIPLRNWIAEFLKNEFTEGSGDELLIDRCSLFQDEEPWVSRDEEYDFAFGSETDF
jgi:hypothetical protein